MAEVMQQRSNAGPSASSAQPGLQRQPSFSSFPPSRSPSAVSVRNDSKRPPRSPQPPMVREDDVSIDELSQHSSFGDAKPVRLRAQYPADSVENHVEYILVASFDIDRGSVMEHQYPGPISGDETMLAELMLPDQAHVRSQDWTIFFLHKDTSAEEEEKEARRERRRQGKKKEDGNVDTEDTTAGADEPDALNSHDDDYSESEVEMDPDGPPLVYVLNLVNTKQDNTVKRFVRSSAHLSITDNMQRSRRQSNGHMHKTPLSTHL